MEPTTKPNIFREAIGVLKKEGWMQGDYYVPGQGCCLYGALGIAADQSPFNPPKDAVEFLRGVLKTEHQSHVGIAQFNDSQTSVDPVIALLEKTAAAWDAR